MKPILVSLDGCDRGVDPERETQYYLYATRYGNPSGWIAVVDCATDSIVDSIGGGFYNPPGIVASSDGKYFAVLSAGRAPEVFDAATRSRIKALSMPSLKPVFLPSAGILLCPSFDSTVVFGIPGFSRRDAWSRPRWIVEHVGGSGQFASGDYEHDSTSKPPSKMLIFDPDGTIVDSFVIAIDSGQPLALGPAFAFSPDGTRFYRRVSGGSYSIALAGYDLANHRLLFLQETSQAFEHCQLSPDGTEIWTTDPGSPSWVYPHRDGSILIHDALTGVLRDSISVYGQIPGSDLPVAPASICFLPYSDKVYINSDGGPILVINANTRHVDKLILIESNKWSAELDLTPRP